MAEATNELVIRIRREVDPAGEAASAAAFAAERKLIAENFAAAMAAEKAKAAAAKATAKATTDAARAVAAAVKQAEKEKADVAKQAAREQTDAEKQAAKDSIAAARERLAETKRTIAESKQLERELFAEGRKLAKEQAAAEAQDQARSIKSSKAAVDAKTKLAQDSAAAQKVAIGSAAVLLSGVEEGWHRANTLALEAIDKVVGYRKALVELATLRPGGTAGQTGPELKKNLAISAATGLPLEGVKNLTTQAYASAQSFLDQPDGTKGLMSPEDYAKSVTTAGKFGAIMGGDPGAYGTAASMIPVLAGKRINADQFETELQRYDKMSTVAGVANPAQLFGQMQNNVGYATTGVVSGPELGALTASYAQTGKPERSSERVQQAISAVSAGLVRDRKMNIDEAFTDQAGTTADYFKGLGIDQKTGTMDRLKMIAADVNAKRAADKDFNANEYLSLQGFGNEGSRAALMEFAGNTDRYGRTIQPLIGQKFEPGAIEARHTEAMRTDPAIRQGAVDANTQLTDVIAGEPLIAQNQARQLAYNQLKVQGKTRGSFDEYVNPPPVNILSPSTWGDAIGRKWHGVGTSALDSIVNKGLGDQAEAMGLGKEAGMFRLENTPTPGRQWFTNETMQQKAEPFNNIAGAITQAGGDPFAKLNEAAAKMLKASDQILDANKIKVPPAMPGRPPNNVGRLP